MKPAVLKLAVRSLLNRWVAAALTVFAIALSVFLIVGVERIRESARASFENTISGADLIVGARSSQVNLILYSIFHIGDATNNITWETFNDLSSREEIAWTIPISLGDSHRGYRVVGTNDSYLEHYQYGRDQHLELAEGVWFEDIFDVVLGSEVARRLEYGIDDSIVVSHGLGEVSFTEHDDKPFRVAGILAPTGTPVDQSVHVSLAAIEAIHVGWQSGVQTPLARMATPERVRQLSLEPESITAMIVGLKSRAGVLRLQRDINNYAQEPLLAAIPALALTQLWQVVGVVERILLAISLCVAAVGLVVILVSIMSTLNERRREMAVLRAVGAGPGDVFFLLVSEAALIAFFGALAGLGVLYAALAVGEPILRSIGGISLSGLNPDGFDLIVVGGITVTAALLAAFPAWRAYRTSLSDGLAVKV